MVMPAIDYARLACGWGSYRPAGCHSLELAHVARQVSHQAIDGLIVQLDRLPGIGDELLEARSAENGAGHRCNGLAVGVALTGRKGKHPAATMDDLTVHVVCGGSLDAQVPFLATVFPVAGEGQRPPFGRIASIVGDLAVREQSGDLHSVYDAFFVFGGIDQLTVVAHPWGWAGRKHFRGLLFWYYTTRMHIGKLQAIGESFGVILPRAELRALGWQKGDHIAIEVEGREFKLHNVRTDSSIRFTVHDGRAAGQAGGQTR